MNVQQKRAGTGGDSDHSAWTKIKKIAVISKRTINSTQKNEAISLSGTGSQVCLTSCRSKEIITPNCSDGAGKEDSVCPLSDDHFLNRMKEVSYLGSDKVLLVKVTKNRNDTDGIKGKSLSPLLQEEKYSLEHFGKRVKLTSKRKSNEESKINVTRLERREPDSVRVRRVMYVDKVDVSVGDDTVNLVNHSQTSHEANRLVRKIVPITLGNYKESLGQPILKQRSQNSSLSASSCDATVTKPVISISNMITKKKGAGEGCLKYIPVCTQSGSNSLAVSEVVAFSNKKKILPGPSYEMLNTSHQLPESTSVLDENLRESNEGIYLNEGCNTKEMQEKSASLYFSEEEATSEMYTLNNDKRKTNDQNEYSSLSEVSSEPLGGWLYTPDNSQDAVDSLLEDLYDGQDPDKPFPDIDNLDCFIPLTEEKNSTFQDLTTSTLDKCLEETILNSPNTSLVEFMNSSQTPTQFVVDGESLKKNSQGSPDFTELIFKSMNQVSSKTDVVLQEDFSLQPQVYSSPLRSLSHGNTSHECPLNNIRDLICDSLSTSTGENKKGLFTDYNQLLMGASEELCAPVGHSTNITVGEAVNVTSSSFSSSNPPSNASHFEENMLLQSHINETDSNSLLKMNRISRVDGCEAVGPSCESSSEVVWILQTPKPSLAPLSGLYLDKNEVSIENEAQCNSRLPENLTNKETYVDINQSSLVNHCRNVVDTNTSTNPLGLNQEGNSIKKLDQTSLLDMTTMQPSRLNIPDPYPCEVMTICGNLTTEKLDHVEVPMFTNLTDDDDSNFNNKHFLPDDSPILRYPELISEILDVQRNCEPAHLNQQGCSSGNMRTTDSNKEVKSLEAATLSEEPSSSGVNSPSYFNDLLDSFLQEVEESNTVIDTEESNTVIDTEESNTVIDTEESNAGIDSDKKSCAYTMNERKNICGQNTAYTLMLNREGNNSRSQDVIGDILSDLGGLSKGEGVEVLQHDTEANSASGPLKTVTASPASTSNSVQKDLSDNNKVKRILKKQRVIRPVLFRTLPGIRPIKCATQGQVENGSQKQMKPLCFILGKDRRLQNQDGSSCWPQREDFKPEHYVVPRKRSTCSSKDGKQLEDGVVQTVVSSTPRVPPEACGVTSSVATAVTKLKVQDSSTEGKSFVLPVGKTGLSISIPINTPTNIPSFFASANLKSCTPSIPSPTTVLPCIEKGPAEAAKITTSIDSQSPALVTNIPQGKKAVFEHQDTRKTIVPTTVFTVGGTAPAMYQVSIPQSFPTESFYMMIPTSTCSQLESGSSTPLNTPIVPSILPRLMSTQPCSNNPVVPTPVNNCSTGKQLVTKYCLKSYVHPIAPKTQQVNSVSYVSAKGPILLNTATSEPVKILINTQPSIINDINCYSLSPENGRSSVETSGSKPRLKSEYVHSLQQKLLKKKPNSDSFKNKFNKSRLLRDELQHHFPDIPESILKLLNLPPKAICRGYFNLRDLKTLHTQALTLRLSVTLRDHISVCKLHNCPTCIEFLRQKKVLSSIEREKALASKLRIKSGRGRSRGRGGRRGRDEPPHTYLAPSKRKLEDVSCNINNSINMKISRADKAIENPDSVSKSSHMDKYLCRRIRVRRSNSESDIHVLLNTHPQKTDEVHSCDDSCLGLHHTLRDSHSEKWLRTEKENSSRNSKILTKRKFVITAENRWKKFQCDNMLKTAAQDLLLKKQLEQDFVAFAEEAVSEKSPKQCGASTLTTLHFNLHALYIGPLNLAAKCNPIFHPKLHVIYSARYCMLLHHHQH
ncbi:uncharacterized protein LOC121870673 [Homarus americanus]|uniref:uncharacterized protein LOC121870673 n=1 Tax=Homarus americanus TaxID=6706 RepID=UPI001C44A131|nr:uncharacterized protein LOC121870673 [Homarus americanus]